MYYKKSLQYIAHQMISLLLTLVNSSELPKLKTYIANSRYKMENIQGIILTRVHPDHIQAANEIFQRCIPG